MVNHFLLSDEELIDALAEVIEGHTYVDESWSYQRDDPEVIYAARRHKEYWDVRKELLERLKK